MNEWFTLRNSRRRPIFQSFLLKRNQRQGSNQPHFFILFISTPMKRIEKKCWVVLLLLHSPSTAPTNQSQIHSTPWICLICGLLIGSFRPAASGPFAPFINKLLFIPFVSSSRSIDGAQRATFTQQINKIDWFRELFFAAPSPAFIVHSKINNLFFHSQYGGIAQTSLSFNTADAFITIQSSLLY